ncbi:MAG: helix-turn-helix domain-containing protein [Sphingomonadales bacterium]
MLQSRNYAPPPDLAPFVRQFFVFRAQLPADYVLIDRLISESAMIRLLLAGEWSAQMSGEDWRSEGPAVLFGPNSRGFMVRVKGPFSVVGVALRPSGWAALFEAKADGFADAMLDLSAIWGNHVAQLCHDLIRTTPDDATVVEAIETCVRERLATLGNHSVDPAMATFETMAREDSTMRVADAADQLGLSGRALERRCCATFGLTPKAILRRSRFLDMAAAVRGISDPGEEERAALRFSDQSHLNREFRHFIDMTPGQFEKAQTPLLNAVLKLRHDGLS